MSQFLKADKIYNAVQLRGTAGQGGPWVWNHTAIRTVTCEVFDKSDENCQLLHNCTKNHIWLEGLPFHVV